MAHFIVMRNRNRITKDQIAKAFLFTSLDTKKKITIHRTICSILIVQFMMFSINKCMYQVALHGFIHYLQII